ncbi:MAG: NYN domain-containing protein [Polyangiales bacterium]|nr:NYN domain-containing protein [Sandaracinaceae bacterium]
MQTWILIDYWNFSLEWRRRGYGDADWKRIPQEFAAATQHILTAQGLTSPVALQETRVYSSYEPGRDDSHKHWLSSFLDRQPGVQVSIAERRWRQKAIHCRSCNTSTPTCPNCNELLGRAVEKTVDSQIVTDLMGLAWDGAYDLAILVTSDKDFIPAVEAVQRRGKKVVNATWKGLGIELSTKCWAQFEVDALVKHIQR